MPVGKVLTLAERSIERIREWRSKAHRGALGAFYRAGGNELLLDNLSLSSTDVVIDAGAYKGRWADEIMCRYGCSVVMFEPVPEFAQALAQRYRNNARVTVIQSALSGSAGRASISIAGDGSSLFRAASPENAAETQLVDVASVLDQECSLLKLNIEGAEYDVLERVVQAGMTTRIHSLLVQFHDNVESASARRDAVRSALQSTHDCVFNYPFVWELWERRPAAELG